MQDPFILMIGDSRYSLGIDEEHGAYYARWQCSFCGESGVSEKVCSSEEEALAEARYRATLHHGTHGKNTKGTKKGAGGKPAPRKQFKNKK